MRGLLSARFDAGGQREAVALLSPILERLSSQAEKLKKIKGGTDRLIRIRMKQLEQRLSGAKQSDPHVYDKYV